MKKVLVIVAGLLAVSLIGCAHKKHHKHHGHHGHHNKMWEKMDANGDGAVTKKEFDKAHAGMFTKMDTNKDGKVTKEEKKAFHKSMKSEKKKECCK